MASSHLTTLREAPTRQALIYSGYRKKAESIRTTYRPELASGMLQKLLDETRGQIERLNAECTEARTAIEKKAQARSAQSTPEARARVEKALSKEGGFQFGDLLDVLVQTNDRAGIAALAEYLPYSARAGQLAQYGTQGDFGKQVKEAEIRLRSAESKLFDEGERSAASEVRELGIGVPLLEENQKRIGEYLDRQLLSGAGRESIDSLYHFQGLPEDKSVPKGLFVPDALAPVGAGLTGGFK